MPKKQTTHSSLSSPETAAMVCLSKLDFSNPIRKGWSSTVLGCQSGWISLNSRSSICSIVDGWRRLWVGMNAVRLPRVCLCHNLICMLLWDWDEKSLLVARSTEALTKYADSPQEAFLLILVLNLYQQNAISDLPAEAGWESPEISICSCLRLYFWGIWFLFDFVFKLN